MVDEQLAHPGDGREAIRSEAVLEAMRIVPRHAFVPRAFRNRAYADSPLPIGEDQTISQPYIVALMTEAADIRPEDRVLEVGAGSGYSAAVLSRLAAEVYTIERHRLLAEQAAARLREAGRANVQVRVGDGTLGWPESAPFDAIVVTAGGAEVPEPLRRQLGPGGRLIMPVGEDPRRQNLLKITRQPDGGFVEKELGPVLFVPLVGERGWLEDESGPASPRPPRNSD